jgi:thioredoxin reductase (NADPH)
VVIVTDGRKPRWDDAHATWVRDYKLPVRDGKIINVDRKGSKLRGLIFEGAEKVGLQALFTVRGDVYHNDLAAGLGADLDAEGQVKTDLDGRTSVDGLYAAGCVTPANCQMIIAAGQGATAAQAINRDLFYASLANHSLKTYRVGQLMRHKTHPKTSRPPKQQSRRESTPRRLPENDRPAFAKRAKKQS